MCDACGDPECSGGREMDFGPALKAAAARMDAIGEAISGAVVLRLEADEDLGAVPSGTVEQAFAMQMGISIEEITQMRNARVGDVMQSVLAGHGLPGAVAGLLLQAWMFGWLVRDEQLKAERAAAGGA